jgi:Protein of unknown function (DUF3551)
MRAFLLILSIVVAAVGINTRAEAQNYPWCAHYSGGSMGGAMNCGFTTFQQCLDTVHGIGGFCEKNDWYKPPVSAPVRHRSQRHSRS